MPKKTLKPRPKRRTVTKSKHKLTRQKKIVKTDRSGKTKVTTKYKDVKGSRTKKGDTKKTVAKNPSPGVYTTKTKRKGQKAVTKTYRD